MRIALITPYSLGPQRGNITTVERISRMLRQHDVEVLVLSADVHSEPEMSVLLASFAPQLIHCFHAHYGGSLARRLAAHSNVPFVITVTGSDLHNSLLRNHPDTVRAIEAAANIVCFHASDAAELVHHFPQIAGAVTVIAQGVEKLPVAPAENFGIADEAFVLLLPAAIRPVKQVEFPLLALKSLIGHIPTLQLVIAGGVIDQGYAATIRSLLCVAPSAEWLDEIAHELMGALYTRADIVLNCSGSESMSNTLLEAMALGRPVLANDIPGNRSLIRHGDTGLLYRGLESFSQSVIRLAHNAELRSTLGQRAEASMRELFSPHHEVAEHIQLYRSIIAEAGASRRGVKEKQHDH